jgi:hypothetical protein
VTRRSILVISLAFALSACATGSLMHTDEQLNSVALGCGLALGELIQDESENRLLLLVRSDPTLEQRACVASWARKNHLKAVFLHMDFPQS